MHFHDPAEHTFDNLKVQDDLELHIVHRRYHYEEEKPLTISNDSVSP